MRKQKTIIASQHFAILKGNSFDNLTRSRKSTHYQRGANFGEFNQKDVCCF